MSDLARSGVILAIFARERRERSGGADFVIDYAAKIDRVWERLIDPQSEEYFKNNGIYNIYEFKDIYADDIMSYPTWKLDKIYK